MQLNLPSLAVAVPVVLHCLLICFMVPPYNVKVASEAVHVEGVKSSFFYGVQRQGLTPI